MENTFPESDLDGNGGLQRLAESAGFHPAISWQTTPPRAGRPSFPRSRFCSQRCCRAGGPAVRRLYAWAFGRQPVGTGDCSYALRRMACLDVVYICSCVNSWLAPERDRRARWSGIPLIGKPLYTSRAIGRPGWSTRSSLGMSSSIACHTSLCPSRVKRTH